MHQIRYFLAVSEYLNFRRAAEQCHVSGPALTRAIQKLEEELGGKLFRRERNLNLQPSDPNLSVADPLTKSVAARIYRNLALRARTRPHISAPKRLLQRCGDTTLNNLCNEL